MALETHQKTFSQPVQPHLFAVCPTMDLIAAVTASNQLEVFRFNGQRAFGWRRGSASLAITALQWSDDGAYIALATSDGMLEFIEAVTGKVTGQVSLKLHLTKGLGQGKGVEDEWKGKVSFVGWGRSLLDPESIRVSGPSKRTRPARASREDSSEDNKTPTLEDYTARILDRRLIEPETETENLPLQLAHIDLESEFPQLSPLPQVEDDLVFDEPTDAYSSIESLDAVLPLYGEMPSPVSCADLTLAFGEDDMLTCFLAKKMNIGAHALRSEPGGTVIGHASNPFSSCHVLLKSSQRGLDVQVLDFESMRQSKHFLELVRRKLLSLHNLEGYILQAVVCLRAAWSACQDLPRRWLENGQEMVQERDKTDFITALYLLATMGDCVPSLKEWITSDIGERNHKRWDAAVTSNYMKITELIQRCLLPALDRANVVASRLRSLAATPNIPVFKIEPRYLTRILHDLDLLRIISNRILQYARLEMRQFETFSAWLAIQVALRSTEPGSSTFKEQGERAAAVDLTPLLQYITEGLTRSRLNYLLARPSQEVVDAPRRSQQQIREKALLHQILDRHADRLLQPGTQAGVVDIADLLYQALFLQDSCREVVEVLPRGLQRGTKVSTSTPVTESPNLSSEACHVRLVHSSDARGGFEIIVAYASEASLVVRRSPLQSSLSDPDQDSVWTEKQIDLKQKVVAARFLDDDSIAVLTSQEVETTRLVLVEYDIGKATELKDWVTEPGSKQPPFSPTALSAAKDRDKARIACLDSSGRRAEVVSWRV